MNIYVLFFLFISVTLSSESNVERFNSSLQLPDDYFRGEASASTLKENFLQNTKVKCFPPKKAADTVRISTFNVHHFSSVWGNTYKEMDNHEQIIDDICALDSDIIGIQEFIWDEELVLKLLEKLELQKKHICFSEASNWPSKPFGNCLISKFPIITWREIPLLGNSENRVLLDAQVLIDTLPTQVIVGHFDVHDDSGNTRVKQLETLVEVISESKEQVKNRVFVLADMNTINAEEVSATYLEAIKKTDLNRGIVTPMHELVTLKESNLIDSFSYLEVVAPYLSCWSARRTDFIFIKASEQFTLNASWVGITDSSDHLPISIDIKIIP